MKLNCKPNQLARVISNPDTDYWQVSDMIVQVTQIYPSFVPEMPAWEFTAAPLEKTCDCGCGRQWIIEVIPDEFLRPIDGGTPGAVDEMIKLAGPAPATTTPVKEHA